MNIRTEPEIFHLNQTDDIRIECERRQVIVGDVFEYFPSHHPASLKEQLKGSIYTIEYVGAGEERLRLKTIAERDLNRDIDVTALVKVVAVEDRYNELLERLNKAKESLEDQFKEARRKKNYQDMANIKSKYEFIKEILL